jgi:hypothetical protein
MTTGRGRRSGRMALGVAIGLLAGLVLVPSALAELPEFNLLSAPPAGSEGTTIVQMNMTTGEFSGTSVIDGEHFTVTGIESGDKAESDLKLEDSSYESFDTNYYEVLPDGNIGGPGSFHDTNGTEESYTSEITNPTATVSSSTSITCTPSGPTDTCTATVTGSGGTPSGNATFSASGGSFSSEGVCVLSGGSCSVTYLPPAGETPDVKAVYSADGTFRVSEDTTTAAGKEQEEAALKEKEAAKKSKEEAEKAKRPSATMVTCNYEFATSENTCLASVGDAGSGTPITPTGSVTFTTTSGGFSSGATCTLAPESTSPSIAACTLVYETANSGLPEITATYGGDARHTGSAGHTQFLGAGSEEGTAETPPGKPGEYPNEIELGLDVPTNGTTVEGAADGANPDPVPVPMTLPGLAGLDSVSAADLKLVETDATKVDNSAAQNSGSVKEMDQSIEKLNQRTAEVMHSANPTEQAEVKTLTKDTTEAIESLTKMLKKQQEQVQQAIDRNVGSVLIADVHRHAKKQKTRTTKPLAYVVQDNVAAGKHVLTLKLKRGALEKLAGKRSSVSVYVRVDMILPSALYKGGLPRVFVKRLTLKRAPGGKGHKAHKKK